MARANLIKLKTLKQTRNFYIWELKREESLTESEKSKYLLAIKSLKGECAEQRCHSSFTFTTKKGHHGCFFLSSPLMPKATFIIITQEPMSRVLKK